jgi:predicted MFS family arabinose efflux permease
MTQSTKVDKQFYLVCIVAFVFFLGVGLTVPVIPKYAQDIGASSLMVGLTGGLFWLPAIFLRPLVGFNIDTKGRQFFLLCGVFSCLVATGLYLLASDMTLLLVARVIHGLGFSFVVVALITLVLDLAPEGKDIEYVGYYSIFNFLGYALGPALGEHFFITQTPYFTFKVLLVTTSVVAVFSIFIKDPKSIHNSGLSEASNISTVLKSMGTSLPVILLLLMTLLLSVAETFIAVYVRSENLGDVRAFFLIFAFALVCVRLFSGKLADKHGALSIVIPGVIFCTTALLILAFTTNLTFLHLGALCLGLGWGFFYPGVFSMVTSNVAKQDKSIVVAIFSAVFDFSFGFAAIAAGFAIGAIGYQSAYILTACFGILSLILVMIKAFNMRAQSSSAR